MAADRMGRGNNAPPPPSYTLPTLTSDELQSMAIAQGLGGLSVGMAGTTLHVPMSQHEHKLGPEVSVFVRETKVRQQISDFIKVLPVSVCANILRVEFYRDPTMHFVVVFINQKSVSFENVDSFPTDQDIAHVALACP